MNYSNITTGIDKAVNEWEAKLIDLSIDIISERRNSQNRTIKQILGHLIDSASNNHQRIIRLQYNKELMFPDYRQDNDLWIELQNYQDEAWNDLIQLWKYYNKHMIHIINSVRVEMLNSTWHDFEGTKVSLDQMINGYLWHLELHLSEINELISEKYLTN